MVFFDAAGTLLRVRGGVGQQYAAVARRFGVDADPAVLDREFPAAFRAAPPLAFPGASPAEIARREREVWRGIVRAVFDGAGLLSHFGPGAFAAYFDAVYAHFEDAGVWELFADVRPTLDALRDLGCPLGIISNFDGRLFRILEGLGLADRFASVTLSSRVGVTKPGREIFAQALRQHGVAAPDALHVGDSPVEDCEGALGAGLRAILIDRAGRHADRPGVLRAASLGAVVDVVRNTG